MNVGTSSLEQTSPSMNSKELRDVSFTVLFARKAVHRGLQSIRGGRICVIDQLGTVHLGDAGENALTVSIQVNDMSFYRDILLGGNLGVAEAYLQGKWQSDCLPTLIRVFCRNMPSTSAMNRGLARLKAVLSRGTHWLARNTIGGSRKNIAAHYDLSNDFFELFLDPTMMYSSAYFSNPQMSLEQASVAKMDRICRQLELKPTDHVMEIGTGWGGFAIYAAKEYGCRVTSTTISEQQHLLAKQRVSAAGLENRIQLIQEDYRFLKGDYDKVVSIEMIEAVGHEFLPTYFRQCDRLLKRGGKLLVQAITIPDQRYDKYRRSVDFIQKYIFPGGHLPSVGAIQSAVARGTDLRLMRQEDFGMSYAATLNEWRQRFFNRLENVRALGFDERFVRMWDYYLSYCEGAFLEQAVGVSHLVWQKSEF